MLAALLHLNRAVLEFTSRLAFTGKLIQLLMHVSVEACARMRVIASPHMCTHTTTAVSTHALHVHTQVQEWARMGGTHQQLLRG